MISKHFVVKNTFLLCRRKWGSQLAERPHWSLTQVGCYEFHRYTASQSRLGNQKSSEKLLFRLRFESFSSCEAERMHNELVKRTRQQKLNLGDILSHMHLLFVKCTLRDLLRLYQQEISPGLWDGSDSYCAWNRTKNIVDTFHHYFRKIYVRRVFLLHLLLYQIRKTVFTISNRYSFETLL